MRWRKGLHWDAKTFECLAFGFNSFAGDLSLLSKSLVGLPTDKFEGRNNKNDTVQIDRVHVTDPSRT